jgi:GNAT superfamily N-acetyltransferase
MTEVAWELVELADNPNTYTPLSPGSERVEREGFVLWMGRGDGPDWNVAQRFRLRDNEVEATFDEVHRLVRAKGRTACAWEVGSHATPADLVDRLVALGAVPDEDDPLAIGMVLVDDPGPAPAGIEVRKAQAPADFEAHARIAATAFGGAISAEMARWAEDFGTSGGGAVWLALLDGEPVATATSSYTRWGVVLNAGSTLPEARGRGAYRALVHARWRDAVDRGTPALVTQAGHMSRPILERLGFRAVCEVHILRDEFDAPRAAG